MKYQPYSAVWEITMGCNMRCKHCGSSCQESLAGELDTEEALRLCDELKELGLQYITLSGGEPTSRKDWHTIAKRLVQNNINTGIITNCWLLDEEIADKIIEAGIDTVGISLDGVRDTHDYIRKQGAYERVIRAMRILKEKKIKITVITTINSLNINQLEEIRKVLEQNGVNAWQLQIGLPMGNMLNNKELLIKTNQIEEIINFAYNVMKDSGMKVFLADNIGYYTKKENEIRKKGLMLGSYCWNGCGAGKSVMGILHNGDIVGCTSVRDKSLVEGNIRETTLKEIWESPDSFSWNRNNTKDKLSGFCRKCIFGDKCLGGCANSRLTFSGELNAENEYCAYNHIMKKAEKSLYAMGNTSDLKDNISNYIDSKNYQLAEMILTKLLEENSTDIYLLKLYGFVSYKLNNYMDAKAANEAVLSITPDDAYANNGLGLTLIRLGETEKGIEYIKKAISLSDESFTDPYLDYAVVLWDLNRREEALEILREGREKYPEFVEKSDELYKKIIDKLRI